ncbi:MAG TPA: BadF/BadG/BcrA/BcrD ATPase family protein [Pyrinomonadaceae bacterium]|jgi:N-acetylglucosamine kinase-like BadF-type ATPase
MRIKELKNSNTKNSGSALFLGIDGGQSHTEAVVADADGNILGRGFGGASNHAEQPGGRARLRSAIAVSVGAALANAGLPPVEETVFRAAHCGMTGGADYKEEIIGAILKAENLVVGHDAPTALCGATGGEAGVVVIAGTGSIVYGENAAGETARVGGLGYLFSDEGSGFWLAVETVKLAVREHDGLLAPRGLQQLVLDFFGYPAIDRLTSDYYNEKISRDRLASLAKAAQEAAASGNETIAAKIESGARILAENVLAAAGRLRFAERFPVAGVGGMFRGELTKRFFRAHLSRVAPHAVPIEPHFNPAIGALLLSYRQGGIALRENLFANLEKSK